MSRFQKIVHSMASGYATLGVNVVVSLASVPLSLHYLSTDEFGLWAVITQVASYLVLLELGMSTGVAMFLFDHKDDAAGREYREVISTGSVVLISQGILVLVLGYFLTPVLAHALSIPSELHSEFTRWMRWQCAITAAGFATRIFLHLLISRHRYDIINYTQALGLVVNLVALWILYRLGWKLAALAATGAIGWVLTSTIVIAACLRLRLIPSLAAWVRPSWQQFKKMLVFARDASLVAIGFQFVTASQTLVVSRTLGLEAAATWAVCTKTFTLVSMLVWRIYDFAAYAFVEMVVRGEAEKLRDRFRSIVMLTASISVWAAVLFAVSNESFVAVWTHDKVRWSNINNWLLAISLVIASVIRCQSGFIHVTKRFGFLRFAYLVEGIIFLGISDLTVKQTGITGMLAVSILCSLSISGIYTFWRTANYFHLSIREVLWGWLRPMWVLGAWLIPWAIVVCVALDFLPNLWRFFAGLLLVGLPGTFLFLRVGLSGGVQEEILTRVPPRWSRVLKRVIVGRGGPDA